MTTTMKNTDTHCHNHSENIHLLNSQQKGVKFIKSFVQQLLTVLKMCPPVFLPPQT